MRSESFARITKRTSKFFPWVSFLSLFFLFDGKWLSLRLKSPAACFTRFGEISGELVENFRRAYGSVREPPTRVPYEKPSTGSLFYLPAFAGGEQDLGALGSPAGSVGAGRLPPANCAPHPAAFEKAGKTFTLASLGSRRARAFFSCTGAAFSRRPLTRIDSGGTPQLPPGCGTPHGPGGGLGW